MCYIVKTKQKITGVIRKIKKYNQAIIDIRLLIGVIIDNKTM